MALFYKRIELGLAGHEMIVRVLLHEFQHSGKAATGFLAHLIDGPEPGHINVGMADAGRDNLVVTAHFLIDGFLHMSLCSFHGSVKLFAVGHPKVQKVDGVGEGGLKIQTDLIILFHTVQAVHGNCNVIVSFPKLAVMLLQIHNEMELVVEGSGIGLKIHAEGLACFRVGFYKNLTMIDVESLDYLAVDEKEELGVPSVIPVVQAGVNPKPELFSVKAFRNRHFCPEPVMAVRAVPVIFSHVKIFPLARGSVSLRRSDKTSFFDPHAVQMHFLHDGPALQLIANQIYPLFGKFNHFNIS